MASVSEISDRFVDEFAALDPGRAARMMGVGLNSAAVRDYSPAGTEALAGFFRRTAEALRSSAPRDETERLGSLYLSQVVAGELAVHEAGTSDRDLSVLGAAPSALRQGFDIASPRSADDWEAVTERMARIPGALAGYRESLQRGLDRRRPGPRRCAAAVAEQCEVWGGRDGRGWFSDYAREHSDVPRAESLRAAATAADAGYSELSHWLRASYLPHASETDGVGEEEYASWATLFLGSALDVDDAYAWGWEELARLQAEQATESDRIEPGVGFSAVRDQLATDPDRAVDGVDAWRAWLQELTDRTIAELDGRHFDIAPALRTCVVSIPPEGSAAAMYYTPPSDDLVEPGRIWFPVLGRTRFPTWDAVTTVFHEAVPGHHLQVGASRMVELTRAHQLGFSSAHGEGWALYAERLMDELGKFERPEYRLGFLSMQAFRAVRVVVDIGLHTGRRIPSGHPHGGELWSYEIAVEYLEEASGLSRPFCESEVLRYLSWPSQATTYKLGERVWLAGRDLARDRLGGDFDVRDWHSKALALGPLGLDDLRSELHRLAGSD